MIFIKYASRIIVVHSDTLRNFEMWTWGKILDYVDIESNEMIYKYSFLTPNVLNDLMDDEWNTWLNIQCEISLCMLECMSNY